MLLPGFILSMMLILSQIAAAQSGPSAFTQALLAARQPLLLTPSGLTGSGSDTLREAVQPARYVLLGEDHYTLEIPQLAAALCDIVHPDAYAVEVGPYAARYVAGLIEKPPADRVSSMESYLRKYPASIAFLNSRAENDLAAHCAGPHTAFWGLDQEFLGAAGSLLAAMTATAPGPQAQQAIVQAQKEEKVDEAKARASGDYLQLFLVAATDPQIAALQKGVDADGNAQTRDLLHELTASRSINRLHASDLGASVAERAKLLKQHFLARYCPLAAANPNAKILFKFGDNHMGKGLNATHDLDLGDFIAEQAAAENASSLHILVLGMRGTSYTMPGYGKPMGKQPFDMAQEASYGWMAALSDQTLQQGPAQDGQVLTLYDLRKLRYRGLDLSPEWEKTIYSFDLLIVEPSLTVAEEIQ